MNGGRTLVHRGLAVMVTCCAVVGCGATPSDGDGSGEPGEAAVQPEENVRYSAVWHTTPDLDLMSGAGARVGDI